MQSLKINAPAKINLWLSVKGRRSDGYHEIESVMQTVTLFDTVTVTKRDSCGRQIEILCDNPSVPLGEGNLCYKAAVRYFSTAGIPEYDVLIKIEKRIPMAAGLAGGSTDAAAVLVALNRLYGDIPEADLASLGGSLGADIPFCMAGGTMLAAGIGDKLSPCPPMPDCFIVISFGGEGVSTPFAYGLVDGLSKEEYFGGTSEFLKLLCTGDITAVSYSMRNIFEAAVIPHRPVVGRLSKIIMDCGGRAMMSGSGPSVIGVFADEARASEACRRIGAEGYFSHLAIPFRAGQQIFQ